MVSIVSIKFNNEEERLLQRAFAASGLSGLSSHISVLPVSELESH